MQEMDGRKQAGRVPLVVVMVWFQATLIWMRLEVGFLHCVWKYQYSSECKKCGSNKQLHVPSQTGTTASLQLRTRCRILRAPQGCRGQHAALEATGGEPQSQWVGLSGRPYSVQVASGGKYVFETSFFLNGEDVNYAGRKLTSTAMLWDPDTWALCNTSSSSLSQ